MNEMKPTVLVVDDDKSMLDLLEEQLEVMPVDVLVANNARHAKALLKSNWVDVVVTDIKMPGQDGLALCEGISTDYPHIHVIVMTAFGNMDRAIEAMRAGAFDFLPKPFSFDALSLSLSKALEGRLSQEVGSFSVDNIIARSAVMKHLKQQVRQIAGTDLSVVLQGESGVGKELFARALQAHSHRANAPFVAVNCAAIPDELLESELFGHVAGSFTGAKQARLGLFRKANGGTLFLDEIGEMPLTLQSKLLRVLEDRKVRPVGSDDEESLDVRIVSATHHHLLDAVEAGRFRRDLFYRLNVLSLHVPPLRERPEDILPLVARFLSKAASGRCAPKTLDEDVQSIFLRHHWPGNVRELQNITFAMTALCPEPVVTPKYVPIMPSTAVAEQPSSSTLLTLEEVIYEHITRVLAEVGGNKSLAAKVLGIDRKTLYNKLKQLNLL